MVWSGRPTGRGRAWLCLVGAVAAVVFALLAGSLPANAALRQNRPATGDRKRLRPAAHRVTGANSTSHIETT